LSLMDIIRGTNLILITPSLVVAWGAQVVFLSVLITQLGVPVPAAPVLLLASVAVDAGEASLWAVMSAAVVAVLFADCFWFVVGRVYGRRAMNALVRVSLSMDTSIKRTRTWLEVAAQIRTVG
jgi:membrane protein DedA with SNARE-associated domain